MRGPGIEVTDRARRLRRDATSAERRLWFRLRSRQLNGFKFVRQEAVGPYFVDFVCREERLVIEVDGATHSSEAEISRDATRSAFLMREGYRVLRFNNVEIFENMEGVLETVLAALERRETI